MSPHDKHPKMTSDQLEQACQVANRLVEHDRQVRCRACVESVGNAEQLKYCKDWDDWADGLLKWAPDAFEPVWSQAGKLLLEPLLDEDVRGLVEAQVAALNRALRRRPEPPNEWE